MLEKPLLEETKSYYRREAAELHADNTCHLFITKVLYSFEVIFCWHWLSVNFEYCEFLTFGTMESNEYINAKKIIEVKEATYAVESLK